VAAVAAARPAATDGTGRTLRAVAGAALLALAAASAVTLSRAMPRVRS
jgi:hypothetical protein